MRDNDETRNPAVPAHSASESYPGDSPADTDIEPLLGEIKQKYGASLLAILVYGSWLRGKRDTMLDFYVLVKDYRGLDSGWQGWVCKFLPPNVYHIHHKTGDPGVDDQGLRAKYALLTLNRFLHAVQYDFHSYFWARFAQPCQVLYVRDDETGKQLAKAFKNASDTFIRRVLPAMADRFESAELWTRGLSLTYRCELRTESRDRGAAIYEFDPACYDAVTSSFAKRNPALLSPEPEGTYRNHSKVFSRKISSFSWWIRRVQGKLLSVLRLTKAAFTFNEPLQYLLWKIERHSGIYIQPSQRQLKHPLVYAWPLLWKLYRRGAFR